MESSSSVSSKRRRLMPIYISSRPRPDLPARFESLNDDTKRLILKFVGDKSYATYAGINKHCREIYLTTPGMTKETFTCGYAPLSRIIDEFEKPFFDPELFERVSKGVLFYNRRDVMDWALQEKKKYALNRICVVATEEGRIDLLEEVWNNLNEDGDDNEEIFEGVDECATRHGKLNVLKWLETKGKDIHEGECAIDAACRGHLHIIQWLQEECSLKLDDMELYYHAIQGGQSHVMKWLKEQNVECGEYDLYSAAKEGNLIILQWLHDEGCPWPRPWPRHVAYRSNRVHERNFKPEVVHWLRVNGYGNRLYNY